MKNRERALHAVVYFAVRCLVCCIQTLSLARAAQVARALAFLMSRVLRIRHQVVEDNLRHAFPDSTLAERERIIHAMWVHLMLLGVEIIQAQRVIHRSNWRDWIEFDEVEKRRTVRLMLNPRALVAVTAHFGNFEMCGYAAGLLGFPTYTLARALDNPFLERYFRRVRERTGQVIFPARGTSELAQAVLDEQGTLALLGDQHAGPKGCWVDFFGRPVSCHKSVALFSLANKIPLVVIFATRVNENPMHLRLRLVGEFDPTIPNPSCQTVPELTQWYNHLLERYIRELPEQYWWLHRRWKDGGARRTKPKLERVATSA